jgi:hypothetical protein
MKLRRRIQRRRELDEEITEISEMNIPLSKLV